MSTGADVCPYCLRFDGFVAARAAGTRFCPSCGTDWQATETAPDSMPHRRDDLVVLRPTPSGSADGQEVVPSASPDATGWGLSAETTEPVQPPPPPKGVPFMLVAAAAAAVMATLVIGFNEWTEVGFAPPDATALVAPPKTTPAASPEVPVSAAPPSLPALPTPRSSPARRSAAVKEHIEQALDSQPAATQAEIGVRVDDGVASLAGTVDSAETLALVAAAAGRAFGVKAFDSRELEIEKRAPPVHVVLPGETLSGVAGDTAAGVSGVASTRPTPASTRT